MSSSVSILDRLNVRHPILAILAPLALLAPACGVQSKGPEGPRPAHTAQQVPARFENLVSVHRVVYPSERGTRVPALVAIPRADTVRGCLIWEYGLGSRKEDSAIVWPGAAQLGLATFSIDLRNHGERETTPLPRVMEDPSAIAEMVRGSVQDLRSGLDYLEAQPYCRGNIAFGGVSLGGIIGTLLAAGDDRVRAVVLASTPAIWSSLLTTTNPVLPEIRHEPKREQAALRILSPLDPDRFVGLIAPRPVMILSGREDPIVPHASARALQLAAREPKTIINYTGGHDPSTGSEAPRNDDAIASFLLRNLVEPTYGISAGPTGTYWQPASSF
jgi:pimeloyl-ACP methyl ester carboxylesterase